MNKVYLLIGGNIGNRREYLQQCTKLIAITCGEIVQQSSIYETAAWGMENQASFYNQILLLHTNYAAETLMQQLLLLEEKMGRKRQEKNGPRTIDIDILYYNNLQLNTVFLTVPHPRITERKFVLIPLVEIAPNYIHPTLLQTNTTLLATCTDDLAVQKISA